MKCLVPLRLAGRGTTGAEPLAEESCARTMAAVVVAGRHLDGKEHRAELLVHADLRPAAGVAGIGLRVLFPRIAAELTGLGDRVEDPQALAGAHVEPAHVALLVAPAFRPAALGVRC